MVLNLEECNPKMEECSQKKPENSSSQFNVVEIEKRMGDSEADVDNPVLKEEQMPRLVKGSKGNVTILPTLVANNCQYRGKLEKGAILGAICAGFEEQLSQLFV